MKIAIIGLGYWGKIILHNIEKIAPNSNIIVCDTNSDNLINQNLGKRYTATTNYKEIQADFIFISTPAVTHYTICHYFLIQNKKTFCEKPLCLTIKECKILFNINNKLYVDWLFIHHPIVKQIKDIIDNKFLGNLHHISMNRLNYGPVRNDVNAAYDLASHDLSILCHLFSEPITVLSWNNYHRLQGKTEDSCLALLKVNDVHVQINSSWFSSEKDRTCIFEFSKGVLEWNDAKNEIKINNKQEIYNYEPLKASIEHFLYNDDYSQQKTITLKVAKLLENEKKDKV